MSPDLLTLVPSGSVNARSDEDAEVNTGPSVKSIEFV